jgi:hypothetical protein
MAGLYDIEVDAGANYAKQFTWLSGGVTVDLTGFTARLKAKTAFDGSEVISLTNGAGLTLGGNAGTINVAITAAVTTNIASVARGTAINDGREGLRYIYDLEIVSAAGQVTRLLQGEFRVYTEVTT